MELPDSTIDKNISKYMAQVSNSTKLADLSKSLGAASSSVQEAAWTLEDIKRFFVERPDPAPYTYRSPDSPPWHDLPQKGKDYFSEGRDFLPKFKVFIADEKPEPYETTSEITHYLNTRYGYGAVVFPESLPESGYVIGVLSVSLGGKINLVPICADKKFPVHMFSLIKQYVPLDEIEEIYQQYIPVFETVDINNTEENNK